MEAQSIPLTAFRIARPIQGCSMFEWEVMPMGLATAPSTFQRWMDKAMQGNSNCLLIYMDDVLVFSPTREQHRDDVRRTFERFRKNDMKVKESKCEFEQNKLSFLGHRVEQGRLSVEPAKISKLSEWKSPLKDIRQVRQFLGLASYYCTFVPHFAEIAAPLTELLRKGGTWKWTEVAGKAMEKLKRALLDACERHVWDSRREDRVTTDASGVGIGATFEQRVEGIGWVPVAFWSRQLSDAEKRYSATDQEWLAVVEAVTRQWRHWLKGRRFVLRMDHGPLKQLLREKGENFSNRQYRWFEKMQGFQFEFEHIPGPSNTAADALSRAPEFCIQLSSSADTSKVKLTSDWQKCKGAQQVT